MGNDMSQLSGGAPLGSLDSGDALKPLRSVLAQTPKWDRYRLLASLLGEFADGDAAAENGRAADAEQVEQLSKKLQRLREEKAALDDTLAAMRADLALKEKQAELATAHAAELQKIVDDQRQRLERASKEVDRLEAEIATKNTETHRLEVERDKLTLQLQRAQAGAGQMNRVNELEEKIHALTQENRALSEEKEQLRVEKNAEIRKLSDEIAAVRASGGGAATAKSGESVLNDLWERLIKAQLARGPVQVNVQSAERLFDAFIELVKFADDFDKSVRPFVTKWVRPNPTVRRPWDVYIRSPDMLTMVKGVIAVPSGQPAGVLKVRLRTLKTWIMSGMIASDVALESVSDLLGELIRGPLGMGSDPNIRLRDFQRQGAPEQFQQLISELLSKKLADAFGAGGIT